MEYLLRQIILWVIKYILSNLKEEKLYRERIFFNYSGIKIEVSNRKMDGKYGDIYRY